MTVADIQQRLSERGYNPGPIDGKFGPLTEAAIMAAISVAPKSALQIQSHDEPPWLTLARAELGVREVPGSGNNPRVVDYFADAAHPEIKRDSVYWCAAFVGAMLKRAGIEPSGSLMARSYLNWGIELKEPRVGCIVVFKRGAPPSGHVAFYLGGSIKVLGGNQSDAVTIATYRRSSLLGFRWPKGVKQ